MRREDAIKKLSKLLGKRLAWRVNPKAPDQDERDEAQAKMRELNPLVEELGKRREARLRELLNNDEEFQRIKTEHEALKDQRSKASAKLHWYRFSAGVITSYGFFEVKAQGDNWEEVIAKLQKEKVS